MKDDIAIEVKDLHKSFILPHEKISSVKSIFTNFGIVRNRKYEKQHALKGVSFTVKKGEFFGIVGRNGSGKSTLLKLLAGIYQPTKGSIQTNGKIVPFIELGVGFNPDLSGRDNVYLNGAMLGFSDQQVDEKYKAIVDFAELERFMDQKLKNYSSGMQVRLAFSVATILAESDILLLDEVLAVGDADFQRKCFEYFRTLKKLKKTVIFVSHDMNSVREYCQSAVLIDSGEVKIMATSNKVADEYSRLFVDRQKAKNTQTTQNRQGNGKVTFGRISKIPSILNKQQSIVINMSFVGKESVEDLVVGIKCKNSADVPLFGTNTTLESVDVRKIEKGERKTVRFTIPNVLNSGRYLIDVVALSADGEVYDWITDAVEFNVNTEKKTGYMFEPVIRVEVTNEE